MATGSGGVPAEPPVRADLGRGLRELELVLRVARPVYRLAAVLLGVLATADALLAVLVWWLQDWTWPGLDSAPPPAGLLLLLVLLLPAGAVLWLRRRVRRGRSVRGEDVAADVRALRGSARERLAGLAEARTRRPRERSWRRFARVAWRARGIADEFMEADAPALRGVLAPFAPGTLAMLWFGAAGLLALTVAALSLALDV
jgi:hypothetical protein